MKKFNEYLELVFETKGNKLFSRKDNVSWIKNPKKKERGQINNIEDKVIENSENLNKEINKSYKKFRNTYMNNIGDNQYLDFNFYNSFYGQNKEKISEDIKTLISKNENVNDLYFALKLYNDALISSKAHVSKNITGLQMLVALTQKIKIGGETKNISKEIVNQIENKNIKLIITKSLEEMFKI